MQYPIGEVAARTGITVRTLHHYDDLGLLVPDRTPGGARVYSDADIERLGEILTYRALGVDLGRIGALLEGGGDEVAVLRRRRGEVAAHIERLRRVLSELDARLEGHDMDPEKIKEVFGDFDPDGELAAEAEERWGDTDAYAESRRRTAGYGAEDWERIRTEGDDIGNRFGAMVDAGVDPESEEAMDLAEEHRLHITGAYYECSYEIHAGLADMYVADPRFAAYWDEGFGEGTAAFVRDAILANAIRNA
jgi:DNA-binding transcriptional MerR regulator